MISSAFWIAASLRQVRDAFPDGDVDEQDGLRIDFDAPSGKGRAWIHVRPSNTEPILRLIAEAPTREDASAVLDRLH